MCNNVEISNCNIINGTSTGIIVQSCNNVIIKNNNITNNGYGPEVWVKIMY